MAYAVDPNPGEGELATLKRILAGLPTIMVTGADRTGTVDSTAAIQSALNQVPITGAQVYLPAGKYLVPSGSTLTCNNPVTIVGDGSGVVSYNVSIGTGADVGVTAGGTTIITTRTTGDLLALNSGGCQVRDVLFWNQTTTAPTAGAGILLKNGTNCHLTRVRITGFYDNVYFPAGHQWTVTNCGVYDCSNSGIRVENSQNIDAGDQSIIGTVFTPMPGFVFAPGGRGAAILYRSGAGLKVTNCKFNDTWKNCISMRWMGTGIGSDLLVSNNSFEGQSDYAIKLERETGFGSAAFGNVVITGNQFAVSSYGIYLGPVIYSAVVSGNRIQVNSNSIALDGCRGVKILTNTLGGDNQIVVGTNTTGCEIMKQTYVTDTVRLSDGTQGAFGVMDRHDERLLPTITTTATSLAACLCPTYQGGTIRIKVSGLMANVGAFVLVAERAFTSNGSAITFSTVGTDFFTGVGASHLTLSFVDTGGGFLAAKLTTDNNANTVTGISTVSIEGPGGWFQRN